MKSNPHLDREALEARLDAYLDGLLSPAETRAVERLLIDPDVAQALAEAIALRELLAAAPDAAPPPDLAERIIAALGVADPGADARADAAEVIDLAERRTRLARTRGALYGASWMVRGPVAAPAGRAAIAGAGTVRFLLGPLGLRGRSS